MANKSFSVLMSLYINEKASYFEECMESITHQTVLPTEIVIVEDGPVQTDVREVLERYKKTYPGWIRSVLLPENKGLGEALAIGVDACRCRLIARMDTDDIAREDRFEKQLREFEKDPELDICGSIIYEFEQDIDHIVAKRTVPLNDEEIREYQKRRDAYNHVSVMFKKESVLKAGNYQPCPLMEDTLLWVHMIQSGAKGKNINEPLVYVRIGHEMYERRGGWSYFKDYRSGRRKVKQTGYISNSDYYLTLSAQFVVAMVPERLRGWIFKNVLHKK